MMLGFMATLDWAKNRLPYKKTQNMMADHCTKYVMRPLSPVHSFLFHFCYLTHKRFSRVLEIAYF